LLLADTRATGAALVVLISIFGPISGAHFNPAVTLFFVLRREMQLWPATLYIAVQITGAIVGVYAAHAMFGMPILQVSQKLRDGSAQAFSEFVATFGLIVSIGGALRYSPSQTALLVGLYITAAYWFTASTSFANSPRDHGSGAVQQLRQDSSNVRTRVHCCAACWFSRRLCRRLGGCFVPSRLRPAKARRWFRTPIAA
jgi:glycerol uptake facilitator-like aquaporin